MISVLQLAHNFFIFLVVLSLISVKPCWATVSSSILKEYPHVLVTNDHGILNNGDIWSKAHYYDDDPIYLKYEDKNSNNFFLNYGVVLGYHWHCFKRENINIVLTDQYNIPDNITWIDDITSIKLEGLLDDEELPEQFKQHYVKTLKNKTLKDHVQLKIIYGSFGLNYLKNNLKTINIWRNLIRNQEYVCILGHFERHNPKVEKSFSDDSTVIEIHADFETITTKKGSNGSLKDNNSLKYQRDYKIWLKKQNVCKSSYQLCCQQ
jgi:hypothetical protein